MSGDRSPTVERRQGIWRLLLHPCGEASSSSPPAPAPDEGRRKGFALAAPCGLGYTSTVASQAYAAGAAAVVAVRSSADWQGRRRRRGKDRRSGAEASSPVGSAPTCDMPIMRKTSLHRFLEKRKDRQVVSQCKDTIPNFFRCSTSQEGAREPGMARIRTECHQVQPESEWVSTF